MEALEFLKAAKRRYINDEKFLPDTIYLMGSDFESYVKDVEEWAKEHPVKTRQTEFLKMFPNAPIRNDGFVDIRPCGLDKVKCKMCKNGLSGCSECFKQFWNEEVE